MTGTRDARNGQLVLGHYTLPSEPPRIDKNITRRTGLTTPPALGRPKSAVIGTGRVDGIPVYGQNKTVTTTYKGTRIGSQLNLTYPEPTTVATIDVVYLLARDYFGRGYDIIRIEADNQVVFDAENGARPTIEFRFYNGLQTTVDPIVKQIVGANAGAHTGDVLLVLPDYPAGQAPTITAVISNAATAFPPSGEIAWTGEVPSGVADSFPHGSAYDPIDHVIYQILQPTDIPSLSQIYLAILDVDTRTERYRVPLEGSEPYAVGRDVIDYQLSVPVAMPGSGLLLVQLQGAPATPRLSAIYDAATGHMLASQLDIVNQEWLTVMPFGDLWAFVGHNFDDGTRVTGIYDAAKGTFVVDPLSGPSSYVIVNGRSTFDFCSFFTADSGGAVYELKFDGDQWSRIQLLALTGSDFPAVSVLWFDPLTGYLVVLHHLNVSPFRRFYYLNPDIGTLIDAFDVTDGRNYVNASFLLPILHNRLITRPGYVLMLAETDSNHFGIYALDIAAKKITTFADGIYAYDSTRMSYVIADQYGSRYFNAVGEDAWVMHAGPGAIPGQITLRNHITDLLTDLGPYDVDNIRFSGFDGLTDWGDVIDKDTSVLTVLRSYQDPLGFVWSDIGDEVVFRKTPTDGSFTADEALADTDLVFKANGSILTDDESDLTSIAKVNLEYVSKDDNYQPRTVHADSFDELYDVTRSTKELNFTTSMVLSDVDGERLVWELLWTQQAKQRQHRFSTYADFTHLIPGDVVSVPSGSIAYTVQISKVNIRENLVIDFEARDFQTSLSAEVAAVSNSGFSGINSVTVQTQYVHLDIPLLLYSDDAGGASLVQYGMVASRGQPNWGGGTLYRGDTSTDFSALFDQGPHGAVIGICLDMLNGPVDPFATTDISSVTIRKISGDVTLLVDRTEDEVLAGANRAFIGREGRWEGVGYKTVVDHGDGTYTLSGFSVRGHRGSEVFCGLHQVGDLFVMVSAQWVRAILHPTSDLGATKLYKAVGFNQSPATVTAEPHVIRGAAETPYACVNLDAGASSPGGIDISWDYRSRLATGLNPANFGEETLAFEIDIYDVDGVTYKRTLTATTNSVHYASADVVTDFGADPPAELFFRVYMMSALDILVPGQDRPVAGRGYEARHHVYFSGAGTPLGLLLALTRA
ncbi:GTA baseplate fiber-binding domain-containing protein [Mesorhizobium silamurunense]|uniref:GTA baseplate fiber-binding domain-containing protein n=1 Tax=Mesorhizobium silamurunense TaxID=499528 RepID=UPI0017837EA7|nr:phage tail protein [Mesorhizobium silamurunense]